MGKYDLNRTGKLTKFWKSWMKKISFPYIFETSKVTSDGSREREGESGGEGERGRENGRGEEKV